MNEPLFSQKPDWVVTVFVLAAMVIILFGLTIVAQEGFTQKSTYVFLKDTVTFLLAFGGLVVAANGLATWKKQIKGSKEFEVAYNLRYSILKLREAIRFVRNPAIWPSESLNAIKISKEKYPDISEKDIEKNYHPYVYEIRWEKITNAMIGVEADLLAAEVLWGTEVWTLYKPLRSKITELNINLEQHFKPDLRTRDYMDIHRVVYGSLGDDDPKDTFGKEVKDIVSSITDYIKVKTS